jgi:integrase
MAGKLRHWKERAGRYSARIVIPPNLRPYLDSKAELEIQLGGDKREALRNHAAAVASIQRQIGIARQKHEAVTDNKANALAYPLTAQQIAFNDYQERIDFDAALRASDSRYAPFGVDPDEARRYRDGFAGKLSDDELEELVGSRIALARLAGNTQAERGTDEWRMLAQALCVAKYEAMGREDERNEGDFTGSPAHPMLADVALVVEEEPEPISLDKLFADYSANRKKVGKGLEAVKRWAPVFADLRAYLGHDDVNKLTDDKVRAWRDEKLDTLSPTTIGKVYLPAIKTVLNWAIENKRITTNAAAEVRQDMPKKQLSREQGYTLPEALKILTAARDYTPNVMKNGTIREAPGTTAAKRWTPILCALGGARIVEMTQLRKRDFRREGDTVVMRIAPEAGGVKVGNYRDVPVHAQIIEMGFIEFVDAAQEGPLFHTGGKRGDAKSAARVVAGRISEWLQSLELVPKDVDPSHAWRHRFKTVSTDEEISKRVIDAIQGHASATAGDNYGDVTLKARKAAIARLPKYELPT